MASARLKQRRGLLAPGAFGCFLFLSVIIICYSPIEFSKSEKAGEAS
jgi:hypothetical protein